MNCLGLLLGNIVAVTTIKAWNVDWSKVQTVQSAADIRFPLTLAFLIAPSAESESMGELNKFRTIRTAPTCTLVHCTFSSIYFFPERGSSPSVSFFPLSFNWQYKKNMKVAMISDHCSNYHNFYINWQIVWASTLPWKRVFRIIWSLCLDFLQWNGL